MFDAAFSPLNTNWGSGATLITNAFNDPVTVMLPGGGLTAVGADIFSVAPIGSVMMVTLSVGGTYGAPTFLNPNLAFTGFTSLVPITSITFTALGAATGMDNFSFGDAGPAAPSSVPEPASVLLLATGLTALVARHRPVRTAPLK